MAKNKTSFSKEHPRPGPGRKKMTPEERAANYDFKAHCRRQLPVAIDLLAKAQRQLEKKGEVPVHDARALAEFFRDSVHGRPAQAITGPDGGPLVFSFAQLVGAVDGAKTEKI